jgi:hypothetical protein
VVSPKVAQTHVNEVRSISNLLPLQALATPALGREKSLTLAEPILILPVTTVTSLKPDHCRSFLSPVFSLVPIVVLVLIKLSQGNIHVSQVGIHQGQQVLASTSFVTTWCLPAYGFVCQKKKLGFWCKSTLLVSNPESHCPS